MYHLASGHCFEHKPGLLVATFSKSDSELIGPSCRLSDAMLSCRLCCTCLLLRCFVPSPTNSNTPAHPEYPSGHQVSVGAILEVILRSIGNKDAVTFTIGSEGTPWLKRTYNTLTAAATEVGGESPAYE
jgi:hypothetical protein